MSLVTRNYDTFLSPGADRLSEELLENENDRRIENVANKVSTLKHVRFHGSSF